LLFEGNCDLLISNLSFLSFILNKDVNSSANSLVNCIYGPPVSIAYPEFIRKLPSTKEDIDLISINILSKILILDSGLSLINKLI